MNLIYLLSWILLFLSISTKAQTVETFTLDSTNVHLTPRPDPVNGQYAATDYTAINKPLVAEPFSDNAAVGIDPTTVHPNATGFNSAFFGGDRPNQTGFGVVATPIYTTRTYGQADFPITISANFFNSQDVALYNESYFFLVPADYTSFSSPTFNIADQDLVKEGVIMGARPSESRVSNNQGDQEPTVRIADNTHNVARNGAWYLASVTLDVDGSNLIVQAFSINGTPVLQNVTVGPLNWLDNFRLGIAVDDLANTLTIETGEASMAELMVDFELSNPLICVNNCIQINNLTTYTGVESVNYNWTFTGADLSSSTDSVINQLCYAEAGTFDIELTVTAGSLRESRSKSITVLPAPELNLGADSLEACNGTPILLEASSATTGSFIWQDGSTSSTLEVNTTGVYFVDAVNPCGIIRDSVFVTFSDPLIAPNLPSNYSFCEADSFILDLTTQNALSYNWSDGPIDPIRTFNAPGNFQLQIANECEEISFDFLFEADNCCFFYAPNAFSPNQDGTNEVFQIFFNREGCGIISDFQLQIFDRWGGKVYQTSEPNFRWDGREQTQLLNPGVYVWRMSYTSDGRREQAYGEILLVN